MPPSTLMLDPLATLNLSQFVLFYTLHAPMSAPRSSFSHLITPSTRQKWLSLFFSLYLA
ncbi:hypothetical protein PCASD_00008 [Puccinia coronata f. sp. avenae]|uniref:Uncharacterized protein n=1 Tax=Puccinia coronata f. sp. avenae TaxID=200324 RepID=A0A2N5S6Z7_9BASI|nr:hypothetical protein PCASD_26155 [Puccinia coronata f. sp. avenae]PLW52389.1 hypothetical protein PCASD_00008 [Puccinia coronata f. sp. avenae]